MNRLKKWIVNAIVFFMIPFAVVRVQAEPTEEEFWKNWAVIQPDLDITNMKNTEPVKVGEQGVFEYSLGDYEGIPIAGTVHFSSEDESLLTVTDDGHWKAIRPGTVMVLTDIVYDEEENERRIHGKYPEMDVVYREVDIVGFEMTIVEDDVVYIHRLYNPNSGEHFYTASRDEASALENIGWNYEYIGWCAPSYGGDPIYRLYNPNAGDHHYTMNEAEKRMLVAFGWRDEGILCNSAPEGPGTVQILRSYNPNAVTGSHNFTSNGTEYAHLESVGWRSEGVAWYGIDAPIPE